MKKSLFFTIVTFGLFLGGFVFAQERIESFDVIISINADSSINVEEKIDYDFDGLQRHGIYRDIPVRYKARGGNYNLRLSDISVVDDAGRDYEFNVSSYGKYKKIKIGDPDRYVTGRKIYVISYKIERAINYFDEYDELYWNATGNEWEVSIGQSSARVIFPEEIASHGLQKECFVGEYGSKEHCSDTTIVGCCGRVKEVRFSHERLPSYNGLTIVVGFPKGLIVKPSGFKNFIDFLKDNLIILLPLLVFAFFFTLWWKKGKDPRGRGTIVPQYDAPDNLTPVEVGTIFDAKVDNRDVSAEIIYLAINGYLKIRRIQEKVFLFKSTDYILTQLKEPNDLENEFDRDLMEALFRKAVAVKEGEQGIREIKLSKLKNYFYKEFKHIRSKIYKSTVKKGYFVRNPNKARASYFLLGTLILMLVLVFGGGIDFVKFVSVLISGGIMIIFGILMPKKTKKGALAKEYILGLKNYLVVAEKERIRFHNAPEKNPKLFEKLLPSAMVLGVEKQWAKQFEGIYTTQPSWYEGPVAPYFGAVVFVSALSDFNSTATRTLTGGPHGAASGRSAFGGGGFSGGGFGGGGGGSW